MAMAYIPKILAQTLADMLGVKDQEKTETLATCLEEYARFVADATACAEAIRQYGILKPGTRVSWTDDGEVWRVKAWQEDNGAFGAYWLINEDGGSGVAGADEVKPIIEEAPCSPHH